MKDKRLQLIWLLVEVFCIIRSALATFAVTMNISNGDTAFSVFTVGVVELSLFAMLLLAGSEAVAPIAALVLIAFSAVLQFAELGVMTGTLDAQSKEVLRYAVSFAPTVLLLVGLLKRLTDGDIDLGSVADFVRGIFSGDELPKGKSKSMAFDVKIPKGKKWVEHRKVVRWRDAQGHKRSRTLKPKGKRVSK